MNTATRRVVRATATTLLALTAVTGVTLTATAGHHTCGHRAQTCSVLADGGTGNG